MKTPGGHDGLEATACRAAPSSAFSAAAKSAPSGHDGFARAASRTVPSLSPARRPIMSGGAAALAATAPRTPGAASAARSAGRAAGRRRGRAGVEPGAGQSDTAGPSFAAAPLASAAEVFGDGPLVAFHLRGDLPVCGIRRRQRRAVYRLGEVASAAAPARGAGIGHAGEGNAVARFRRRGALGWRRRLRPPPMPASARWSPTSTPVDSQSRPKAAAGAGGQLSPPVRRSALSSGTGMCWLPPRRTPREPGHHRPGPPSGAGGGGVPAGLRARAAAAVDEMLLWRRLLAGRIEPLLRERRRAAGLAGQVLAPAWEEGRGPRPPRTHSAA